MTETATGQKAYPGTYDVMDTTGKVKEWVERDGLVRVWRSVDLGADRPDIVTSIAREIGSPHWAYPREESYEVEARALRFFLKGPIAFKLGQGNLEWSDTPVGERAAWRAVATLPKDNAKRSDCHECTRSGLPTEKTPACQRCKATAVLVTWPPLRLAFRYTVERVVYQTRETYQMHDGTSRHCGTHFRVAVIQWSLRLPDEE